MSYIFAQHGLSYLSRGFSPIPILSDPEAKGGGKAPGFGGYLLPKWQRFGQNAADRRQVSLWARDANCGIGLACGFNGLVAIDVDDPRSYPAVLLMLAGKTAPSKVGRKGATLFFHDPSGTISNRKFKAADKTGHLVEVLSTGNCTVIPPSIHPKTLRPYRWGRCSLDGLRPQDCPVITQSMLDQLKIDLAPMMPEEKSCPVNAMKIEAAEIGERERRRYCSYAQATLMRKCEELASAQRPGRNRALFEAVCTLGRYVKAGIISESAMEESLLPACEKNGLIADNGLKDFKKTIGHALAKCQSDGLNPLKERG